jgi:SAM-dependent methyltransferase
MKHVASRTESDQAWEELGRTQPYSAVLEHASRAEFFASGEEHVAHVLKIVHERIDPGYQPTSALDFGCGVGRVLIPLARLCGETVGVDVSDAMLSEARRNCDDRELSNVELISTLDELADDRQFDLVHTYIVLQHVARKRGMEILSKLVDRLATGGVGVLHVQYARTASPLRKGANWARKHVPGVNDVANVVQGVPRRTPLMQMNVYFADEIFRLLYARGCRELVVRLGATETGGYLSAMILFRKAPPDAVEFDS